MERLERSIRRKARKRRLRLLIALPVAVLAVAAGSVIGSGAVFTSASANPANVFTAGNLHHTNNKSGAAILTASLMKPGDSTQGTVTINNDGDLGGTFSITTSNMSDTAGSNGGKLSDVLQLAVYDQTTSQTIYSGAIKSVGTVSAGTYAAGASHTYRFTVTFPDGGTPGSGTTGDNAYKGSSMSIEVDWNEVQ
jgi:spore coat-associated protein N